MGIVRQPLFSVEYSLKLLEASVPVSLDGPARGMDNVRHLLHGVPAFAVVCPDDVAVEIISELREQPRDPLLDQPKAPGVYLADLLLSLKDPVHGGRVSVETASTLNSVRSVVNSTREEVVPDPVDLSGEYDDLPLKAFGFSQQLLDSHFNFSSVSKKVTTNPANAPRMNTMMYDMLTPPLL